MGASLQCTFNYGKTCHFVQPQWIVFLNISWGAKIREGLVLLSIMTPKCPAQRLCNSKMVSNIVMETRADLCEFRSGGLWTRTLNTEENSRHSLILRPSFVTSAQRFHAAQESRFEGRSDWTSEAFHRWFLLLNSIACQFYKYRSSEFHCASE